MSIAFNIPRFQFPAVIAKLGSRLPQWPHTLGLVAALNAACRFKLLPDDSLDMLEERTFCIRILDTGATVHFTFSNGVFRPLFSKQSTPDLTFSANFSAFLQLMARQEDPDTLFFNRELSIEGDTELGLVIKNMLDAIELPSLPAFLRPA